MDSPHVVSAALSRDAIFELLAAERRRTVLRRLDDSEEPVPVTELVAAVVARESDVEFTSGQHERVAVSLEHVHLPKLDDVGVIEYDDVGRTASLGDGHELLFEHRYLADGR